MSQQCTSCSADSPDGAKFCLECGSAFARACPSCGHPAGGGKFCGECGSALAGAVPAPRAAAVPSDSPVSERRTTSVLFGDLVSFTTLSESRDPEEVRELLSSYFAVARTVVGRYGGTIEKFIGDAVMAVWGVPVAHEDDAERAVRAGLDLVAEVAALGESVGAPGLAMRVGVVTGSVAVTLGATNEGMVAGDAVNTAARVQSAAEPNTVWVDSETRGLTAAAIAFSDMGEHELKGKAEPARLFRADTVVAAIGGAQRVDGLEAPMTGRDSELRQLKELFHATVDDGRGRIVLVTGVAGIGKSRLGWEFEKYTDGLTQDNWWHRGRCLSYGDGVAFWAFAEMVRSRLGLLESDDRAAIDQKVREGVQAVAANADEAEWLIPRVAALLSGGDKAQGFDRTDLFASWTTYLERVANGDSLVLLFEDTQHADAGLLDLIEHLLETSRAKLFVVVLTRPELLEVRPSLASGRRSTVFSLDPLDDPAMTTLVDALVGDLPSRARTALVARSEGVPLYAVETVRSLIDRDAVQARDGRYAYVDQDGSKVDLDQLAAPISLHTLVAARLDALTPIERRTVQDASVLGLSFRQGGLMKLSDVSGFDLDTALAGLVRKGVIETQTDPRSPELGSFRFLQAIVREVAYSTLARKDRRTRHLAAADHLESEGEEFSDAVSGIIAQHLLDALEASSASDPDRSPIAARARDLLGNAAERAEALGSPAEALRCCLSALQLEAEGEVSAKLRLRAARNAVLAGQTALGYDLAQQCRDEFLALGSALEAGAASAVHGQALVELGRHSEALSVVGPVLEQVADLPGSEAVQLLLMRPYGTALRNGGDTDKSVELAVRQMGLAETTADPTAIANGLNGLAIALIDRGSPTAYKTLLQGAVAISREHHLTDRLGRSLANLLGGTYADDLTAAAQIAIEALEVSRQVGDNAILELATVNASYLCLLTGDWDALVSGTTEMLEHNGTLVGALEVLRGLSLVARGLPLTPRAFDSTDDDLETNCQRLFEAMVLRDQGDLNGAAALAASGLRLAYGGGDVMDDFEVFAVPAIEMQLDAGALDEAEGLLALAAPLRGSRASKLLQCQLPRLRGMLLAARGEDPEPELRTAESRFADFGALFYLARTRLDLGHWLVEQGRHQEAGPLLTQAREVFERLSAAPSLAELDALTPQLVQV
ncbi:MAG: hypothetical protein JWO22_789 [Frankiales bacterium]|nr:hypothetical protein [Frankiales bacterium]